jgi:hypothetical protein
MRKLALLLACAILPAAAQEAKEAKPAPQPERRPLNLKLDNPGSFATVAPRTEREEKQDLPGLGEDARPMPTQVPRSTTRSPFPDDSNPGR